MADPRNNDFVEFVLDQLRGLRDVRKRRMFGAFGLYQGDFFFGIVDDGRLYLLTDEQTRTDYETRGMKAFEPVPGQVLKNYFEVPVDVLEDDSELSTWARRAVEVQRRKSAGKKRPAKRSGPGRSGPGRSGPGRSGPGRGRRSTRE